MQQYKSYIDEYKNKLIFKTTTDGLNFFLNTKIKKNLINEKKGYYGFIHILLRLNDNSICKYILKTCDVNLKDKDNMTVLDYCYNINNIDKIYFLLNNSINIKISNIHLDKICSIAHSNYLNSFRYYYKNINSTLYANKYDSIITEILNYNSYKPIYEKKLINYKNLSICEIKKILSMKKFDSKTISNCINNLYYNNYLINKLLKYEKNNNIKIDYNDSLTKSLPVKIYHQNIKNAQLILQYRKNINDFYNNHNLIMLACKNNNLEEVKYILSYKPNLHFNINYKINSHLCTTFFEYVCNITNIDVNIVKKLIDYDKTIYNSKVFNCPVAINNQKLYEYLKEKYDEKQHGKINYNKILYYLCSKYGNTKLPHEIDHTELIKEILPKITDINYRYTDINNRSIIFCIKTLNVFEFNTILKYNPDLNLQCDNITVLILIIYHNRIDLFNKLLQHNFKFKLNLNFNLPDKNGYTALMYSLYTKTSEMFDKLLKYEQNINLKNINGNNILMLAIIQNNIYHIKQILNKTNIDINTSNNNNDTALSLAIKNNSLDIVQEILKYNPIINISILNIAKTANKYIYNEIHRKYIFRIK
tara:strand:- start:6560 stop:8329 length:1770 start_codon:yes stop_codon:yes gene_type:complete